MQVNRRIESEKDMLETGARLAQVISVGDVFALTGGLGAGKTTLARGIIQALCGHIEVPSPTYTIVQTYSAPDFELWHCDLYRLDKPDDIFEVGLFEAMEDAACLIEWPERMGDYLPAEALTIDIQFDGDGRTLKFSGVQSWAERLANV